ncbi:hypothetical protein ABZ614_11105 [Streptomyces sp. NPDC013178]|uniref:hypothetical protein n=1 Tax=Streptomyces sp. NPDC013178 TaxID=3155118 RepID=UPI0033D11349
MKQAIEFCQPLQITAAGKNPLGQLPSLTGSDRAPLPRTGVPTAQPWVRQRVKVPMRLVEGAHYSDAALSVYVKVKALAQRPEGCTAGVATLASYLGLSPSTVQRGLAELRSPGPDGVVELPDSRRRSLPGGCGTTAQRRVRPMKSTERFIWIPVVASECLRPRLLRAFAAIAYAVAQRHPLTVGVLAGLLRHHSGRRAGMPITAEAAGRVIEQLAASGWITVQHRAGERGRHRFVVHDGRTPPIPVPSAPASCTDPDDRSGTRVHEASLAYEEDLCTDRPENRPRLSPPAVGELPVVERESGDSTTPAPRANSERTALERTGRATDRPQGRPYTGPPLTFSARLHAVLEPVRFLLEGLKPYVLRRIGRNISHQLAMGAGIDRLRSRLTQRLAGVFVADIRDVGRWLLGVALPRWGCADPDCETGILWSTGARCRACREAVRDRRRAQAQQSSASEVHGDGDRSAAVARRCAPSVVHSEPDPALLPSRRPGHDPGSLLPRDEPCTSRSSQQTPAPTSRVVISPCRGRAGTCGRVVPHGLCWRCRLQEGELSTETDSSPGYSPPTSAGSREESFAASPPGS